MSRRRQIIIVALLAFGIIAIVVSFVVTKLNPPAEQGILRDKDTNEIVIVGHTGYVGATLLPIFGENNLYTQGVAKKQFKSIRHSLEQFMGTKLDNKYDSLTVRPQDLKVSGNIITTSLRLGQSDTTLPISITLSQDAAIVRITDSTGGLGGNYTGISELPYEETLFTLSVDPASAKQSGDTPPVIIVTAAEGYRNSAVSKMKEFGYNTADLQFTFKNYTSPFSL